MEREQEFVYWRHLLPIGIKVEEVSGGARYGDAKVWLSMARQIYCENGRDGYRELEHFESGAPYLAGENTRISITHTSGLLAVATLPKTPETPLHEFAPRTAMGIDAERIDREQVVKVRSRFLNEEELAMIPENDVAANVTAWTAKEAMLKASMKPSVDIREGLKIKSLPTPMVVNKGSNGKPVFIYQQGEGEITVDGQRYPMNLFCYDSDDMRITIAYSPKCATFAKD